jgi:3-oxoadipate enol-lactonase
MTIRHLLLALIALPSTLTAQTPLLTDTTSLRLMTTNVTIVGKYTALTDTTITLTRADSPFVIPLSTVKRLEGRYNKPASIGARVVGSFAGAAVGALLACESNPECTTIGDGRALRGAVSGATLGFGLSRFLRQRGWSVLDVNELSIPLPASTRADVLILPRAQMYYEEAGKGTPVVFIHGGFGDRRMWDAQFAEFAKEFRVVRYDHRGFGKSTTQDVPYSAVEDLVRLMDRLHISKAHIIGNSVGGALALDFAVLHPERTEKVVVVSSGANGIKWSAEDVASVVAVFNTAEKHGADSAAALWLQNPMVKMTSKDPHTALLLTRMVRDNRRIFSLGQWPEAKMTPSTYDRLGELRMPVLFVGGDEDTKVVQRVILESAQRIKRAEVFWMNGADHLPQMTDAREFNWYIRNFLLGLKP